MNAPGIGGNVVSLITQKTKLYLERNTYWRLVQLSWWSL